MRIAVLASPDAWHFLDLKRAAAGRHDVFDFPFDTLAANIGLDRTFNLNADCVVVRTMPLGSLQQVVFRMDMLGQLSRTGTLVLNSPKSIEAAVDKYLSLALLDGANIPVPSTGVCQDLESALECFEILGKDVVVKPLFGSMGNGIMRIQELNDAKELFGDLIENGSVVYQQEFIEHDGYDIRMLVIGDEVFGMKRVNRSSWITNISQGGTGVPYLPTAYEKDIAMGAARVVGAHFAGVDLMYESGTGRLVVLEINAVPGWRATTSVLGIDVAELMLTEIEHLKSSSYVDVATGLNLDGDGGF